jgi:sugar phosphate isomerase/epimerase
MHLSVLLSSLPLEFEPAVQQASALGFGHVDVVAVADRPASHRDALADSGVLVSCAAVGRGLPDGQALDAESVETRRAAVNAMKRHIADAAAIGATHAYVISGMDGSEHGLTRFAEACRLLADFAAERRLRLCLEHIPGRALSTAAATLTWLEALQHDNLYLLLDIGHCLITAEEPANMIRRAGPTPDYVHLDDNDGVGDLHWPLLSGQLTTDTLESAVEALREMKYAGALTLELAAHNPEPIEGLRRSKEVMDQRLTGAWARDSR